MANSSIIAYFRLVGYNVAIRIMNKININRAIYKAKRYLTTNNIVALIAAVLVLSWVWGSIGMMQRNYTLQKNVDDKKREVELLSLQVETLKFQQNYLKSDEYKELAAREKLGLVMPGEKVLILPANSPVAKDSGMTENATVEVSPPSNFELWLNFLLGNNSQNLQD